MVYDRLGGTRARGRLTTATFRSPVLVLLLALQPSSVAALDLATLVLTGRLDP
jgi:hypothetical protein